MNTVDFEDYKCPCCMNFIYDNYKCSNEHNICGNCYIKVKECPICRNKKISKSDIKTEDNIKMKECKNKHKGCNLCLYYFDDEHELDCMYNPLHCKFCNLDINDVNFDNVIEHYNSNCSNIFKILKYTYSKIENGETEGRKFYLQSIKTELTLINIDDQYVIIIVPRLSQKKINFIIFSPNNKYKLSNFKIKLLNSSGETILESNIYYKKMHEFSIPCDKIQSSNNLLNFTVENIFILNRKKPEHNVVNNVHFVQTYSVEEEPGSAGNWTKESYDKMLNKFINIFNK